MLSKIQNESLVPDWFMHTFFDSLKILVGVLVVLLVLVFIKLIKEE